MGIRFVFGLVLMASALSGSAIASPSLSRGTYSCRLKEASKHFSSKYQYELRFQDAQITLTREDGKKLIAKKTDGYWLVQSGDLLPKRKFGEFMTSWKSDDLRSLELVVSVSEGEGSGTNERFDCSATEAPALSKSRLIQFDCKTEEAFDSRGRARIRFGVALTDSTKEIDLTSYTGEETDDEDFRPVTVTPKNELLDAFNENSSVSIHDGRFTLFGDSAGVILVTLELYETTGYENGFLRVEDRGEGSSNSFSHVSCKVTGEF